MDITESHINIIKEQFNEMHSLEDLLSLLNLINSFLYGNKARPIQIKSLTYYSSPRKVTDSSKEFKIPKKSGGFRTIHAPKGGLKSIQRSIAILLQSLFEPHPAATGFVDNKSIVDNARAHVDKEFVFNIDLKDFFPSIDKPRFWKRIQYSPFNLNKRNRQNRIGKSYCRYLFYKFRSGTKTKWAVDKG
ncbi:MAG: reverse transcriptase domain-containing protein [Balneolaceae bacterium]|nr:reverse transcriptase domain-containing protein [Balneolaceae bacterium]